jgi:hypothetical protein
MRLLPAQSAWNIYLKIGEWRMRKNFFRRRRGLASATSIAETLQMELDEDGTRNEADEMHELYFAVIVRVTRLPTDLAVFKAAAYRNLNAFVPISGGEHENIPFDEQLDTWLLTCT